MGDHGEPAQAEQVGAAVGVGVEAATHPAGGGADQQAADLSAAAGRDLFSQRFEDDCDRALEQLQDDVAGEAVADDDVGGTEQQVAALGVAAEVEALGAP